MSLNLEDRTKIFDLHPDQNFEDLKTSYLQAQKNSVGGTRNQILFKDEKFPPNAISLNNTNESDKWDISKFTWMRASELVNDPKFIVDGASRFDVNQGSLGNCWVLASVASLTLKKKLFARVVPNDQSFDEEYAGIFHFRFWQDDRWVDVVVDDYLPTIDGQIWFLESKSDNEFWSALLEKAYAKINGSYQATWGGWASRSLTDLTGGISEVYQLEDMIPDDIFTILIRAQKTSALMTCSTPGKGEKHTPEGLISGRDSTIKVWQL